MSRRPRRQPKPNFRRLTRNHPPFEKAWPCNSVLYWKSATHLLLLVRYLSGDWQFLLNPPFFNSPVHPTQIYRVFHFPCRKTSTATTARVDSAIVIAANTPSARACTATTVASRMPFLPILRATIAVMAMLKPVTMEYTRVMMDSVRPAVATAYARKRATKKKSITAKTDSINRGTGSSKMARPDAFQ